MSNAKLIRTYMSGKCDKNNIRKSYKVLENAQNVLSNQIDSEWSLENAMHYNLLNYGNNEIPYKSICAFIYV